MELVRGTGKYVIRDGIYVNSMYFDGRYEYVSLKGRWKFSVLCRKYDYVY